ncbi:MAG: hypothetical protein JSW06_02765 [Thermoplasmatales archaeon]|nr:MAG: hypothetical protein JSW06_02765 [Thermoplasmatales archaeon]
MPEFQTTVNNNLVVRGSGKLEVAPYTSGTPAWVNVGAIKSLVTNEELTVSEEENDNADSTSRVSKQEVTISFIQLELLNLDVWEIMRGSIDTIIQDSNETKILSGNKSDVPKFMVRITTKNDSKTLYFMAYNCTIKSGFTFEYQADEAEDARIQNPLEILCKTDSNRNGLVFEIESNYFVG